MRKATQPHQAPWQQPRRFRRRPGARGPGCRGCGGGQTAPSVPAAELPPTPRTPKEPAVPCGSPHLETRPGTRWVWMEALEGEGLRDHQHLGAQQLHLCLCPVGATVYWKADGWVDRRWTEKADSAPSPGTERPGEAGLDRAPPTHQPPTGPGGSLQSDSQLPSPLPSQAADLRAQGPAPNHAAACPFPAWVDPAGPRQGVPADPSSGRPPHSPPGMNGGDCRLEVLHLAGIHLLTHVGTRTCEHTHSAHPHPRPQAHSHVHCTQAHTGL